MELQTPSIESPTSSFSVGAIVVYGLHGKCCVRALENRTVGDQSVPFYKLEVLKSPLSRSTKLEPAIWVPVASAVARGLRTPLTAADAQRALELLASREYYFPVNEAWSELLPKLEKTLQSEGGQGIAKVVSCLHVLKKKQIVPTQELSRLYETLMRLLVRELSDTLNETPRVLEERIQSSLRRKLIPDH